MRFRDRMAVPLKDLYLSKQPDRLLNINLLTHLLPPFIPEILPGFYHMRRTRFRGQVSGLMDKTHNLFRFSILQYSRAGFSPVASFLPFVYLRFR